MKFDRETFVVDLNDVAPDGSLYASRRDTIEHGPGVLVELLYGLHLRRGDRVEVYSDDENKTWEAEVVDLLRRDQFTVRVNWRSGLSATPTREHFGSYCNIGPASSTLAPVVSR